MTATQLDEILPPDAREELLLRRADPGPLALGAPVRRRRRRDWRPLLTAVVTLAVLAVVAVVHLRGMYTAPLRFDDEGTYVSQARALLDDGRLSPYTYWYDHPPLGWVVISGWLWGPASLWHAPNLIGSGRQLMLVTDVLSAGLVVLLGRRLGQSALAAGGAALLFALSPLALTYHRMVLLDNLATPLLLLGFVLALSPSKRLAAAFGSGLAMAAAVLTKETALLMVPFVLWALWRACAGPTRRMCVSVFGLGFALPALLYPLYAITKGELLPGRGHVSLYDGVLFQLFERRSSGSVFDPTSDAHKVVSGWLTRDPYLLAAAAATVLPALAVRRLRPVAAALLLGMVAVLRPGYLPVPYVVALLPLAALVVTGVADRVVRLVWAQVRPAAVLSGRAPALRGAAAMTALLLVAIAVPTAGAAVASSWRAGDTSLEQVDFDRPYQQSTAWVEQHLPADARLLVDNVTWTDLIDAGRPQRDLVWFTKPDFDLEIDRVVHSWRDVDYVVSSDIMRTTLEAGPVLRQAQQHSVPVATFGSGSGAIVVRKVVK